MDEKAAAGDETKKSPWNSLEVARLLLAAITPLLLFWLGLLVNTQNIAREEANRDRSRKDQFQAEVRTMVRDAVARREAALIAKAARDEQSEHEIAMRREADDHDARLRREAIEEARGTRNLSRRVEVWNQVLPLIQAIRDRFSALIVRPVSQPPPTYLEMQDIEANMERADALMIASRRNFSSSFMSTYIEFTNAVGNTFMRVAYSHLGGQDLRERVSCLTLMYENLTFRVDAELADDGRGRHASDFRGDRVTEECRQLDPIYRRLRSGVSEAR